MKYTKKYLTYEEQIEHIKTEKFIVKNEISLRKFLANVNYFKLREYFKNFQLAEKNHGDIPIEKVIDLYYFNRELRSILLKMSEKIEISIKNKIAYTIGKNYGTFGHISPESFHETFNHEEFMKKLKVEERKGSEDFIIGFKKKYTEEEHLPIWIAIEIMTFGTVSKMYDFMHNKDKKEIARNYGLNAPILSSWLANLTLLRNFCAHNSQIWSKNFKPIAKKPEWDLTEFSPRRIAGMLYMMKYMIDQIKEDFNYTELTSLLKNYFEKDTSLIKTMGFSEMENLEIFETNCLPKMVKIVPLDNTDAAIVFSDGSLKIINVRDILASIYGNYRSSSYWITINLELHSNKIISYSYLKDYQKIPAHELVLFQCSSSINLDPAEVLRKHFMAVADEMLSEDSDSHIRDSIFDVLRNNATNDELKEIYINNIIEDYPDIKKYIDFEGINRELGNQKYID